MVRHFNLLFKIHKKQPSKALSKITLQSLYQIISQMKKISYENPQNKSVLRATYEPGSLSIYYDATQIKKIYEFHMTQEEFEYANQYQISDMETLIDILGQQMKKPNQILFDDAGVMNVRYVYQINGYQKQQYITFKMKQVFKAPQSQILSLNKLQKLHEKVQMNSKIQFLKKQKKMKEQKQLQELFGIITVSCLVFIIVFLATRSLTLNFMCFSILLFFIGTQIQKRYFEGQNRNRFIKLQTLSKNDGSVVHDVYLPVNYQKIPLNFYKIHDKLPEYAFDKFKYLLNEEPIPTQGKFYFSVNMNVASQEDFTIGLVSNKIIGDKKQAANSIYYANKGSIFNGFKKTYEQLQPKGQKCCYNKQLTMLIDQETSEICYASNDKIVYSAKLPQLKTEKLHLLLTYYRQSQINDKEFL